MVLMADLPRASSPGKSGDQNAYQPLLRLENVCSDTSVPVQVSRLSQNPGSVPFRVTLVHLPERVGWRL